MACFNEAFSCLNPKSVLFSPVKVLFAILLVAILQLPLSDLAFAEPENPKLANDRCLRCHGKENYSRKTASGEERALHVNAEKFNESVHGAGDCINCHTDIETVPHKKNVSRTVGCVRCHQELWEQAQLVEGYDKDARLGVVVEQIESYMRSIHARPNIDDQSRTNATCYDCHDAHYISTANSLNTPESKLRIPNKCGSCHSEVLDTYMTSVHGKEIGTGNARAAVCTDCHSAHNIDTANDLSGRLAITAQCGNCHEDQLESYVQNYHGKITQLG